VSEWWTYTPSDLLLFSPRVYYRLIELHNLAVWPVHIGAALLALLLVRSIVKPSRGSGRLVAVSLGAMWVWVAWSFLWHRYAQINWVAAYVAPMYALEGLLFIWVGCARGGLSFGLKRTPASAAGLALLLVALLGYPLIAPGVGRNWLAAEMFAVVPDPTAATSLAVLALSSARDRALLMVIPCLWCFIAAATLWTMASPDFVAAPLISFAAMIVAVSRHRCEVHGRGRVLPR
jgi:hypothetical protein